MNTYSLSTLPAEAPLYPLSVPTLKTPSHLYLEEAGAVITGMIPLSSTALGQDYTGMICWHIPWSSEGMSTGWVTSGLLSTRGWGVLMDGDKSLQKIE